MFKKYINKKYLAPVAVAAAALAIVAALVGYEKACQEQDKAQERAFQAKLQARASQKSSQKLPVRKLIKVDIQKPFAQRFPAYRHSKRVYNQVTPKKRTTRNSGFDDLERLALEAQADAIKPDKKKAKPEPDTAARAASSYSSSGYNSNYNNSYNSSAYSQPYNAMSSTSPVSTGTQGARSHTPQAPRSHYATPHATPRAHAPAHRSAPVAHEHAAHDSGSRVGGGQSRPSMADTVKAEQAPTESNAQAKPAAKTAEDKKEDKKDKETEREFNPSAAKPKPTRPKTLLRQGFEGQAENPAEPTLEEILNNHGQLDSDTPVSGETEPSFTDKFKAGVQSLVELLVTVSMVKNGWDYVKQTCDWLESTFGIGKWVRSLIGSGPQPESVAQAVQQELAVLPAQGQAPESPAENSDSAPAPELQEPAALPADNSAQE